MKQGIDMSKSSWENPEGHQPRERTERAPAPEPVCEAAGPDGWVCDLKPNHGGDEHEADAGDRKVRWSRKMVALAGDPEPRSDDYENEPDHSQLHRLVEIRRVVVKALESQFPIAWATALTQIEELTRGY